MIIIQATLIKQAILRRPAQLLPNQPTQFIHNETNSFQEECVGMTRPSIRMRKNYDEVTWRGSLSVSETDDLLGCKEREKISSEQQLSG